jgi:hypothetical protein
VQGESHLANSNTEIRLEILAMTFSEQFDRFHTLATEATGLNDFGPDNYREPMRRYLADVDKYGEFGDVGQGIVTGTMVGLLCGRLITRKGLKEFPESRNIPIRKPIFVIGLTRSGTTVLHRLITHDPNVQHLPFWLANTPMPRPPREDWPSNLFYQQTKAALDGLAATMPGVLEIHPMAADKADECRYLMDQTFWSNTFCTTANVPEYQDWQANCDSGFAYEYYRQALQLIANGDPRRWVLKDPAHLFGLDGIFKTFPDACIVHTHRDPFDAMASTVNLTYLIRKMREPSLTLAEVARQVTNLWGLGLHKMEQARRKYDPSRFIDLHMLEVRRDPLDCLERIYGHFDQPITIETRQAWERQLKIDPNQSHASSEFDINECGLDKDQVAASVGSYQERYQNVLAQAELT